MEQEAVDRNGFVAAALEDGVGVRLVKEVPSAAAGRLMVRMSGNRPIPAIGTRSRISAKTPEPPQGAKNTSGWNRRAGQGLRRCAMLFEQPRKASDAIALEVGNVMPFHFARFTRHPAKENAHEVAEFFRCSEPAGSGIG